MRHSKQALIALNIGYHSRPALKQASHIDLVEKHLQLLLVVKVSHAPQNLSELDFGDTEVWQDLNNNQSIKHEQITAGKVATTHSISINIKHSEQVVQL